MDNIDFTQPPTSDEGGVLSKLWRKILTENNFTPMLGYLINRYVNKHNSDSNSVIKTKSKSTLIYNIASTKMTFKVFLDLVFNFLRAKKLTISIKVEFANGMESVHTIAVENDISMEDVEDEMEKVKK